MTDRLPEGADVAVVGVGNAAPCAALAAAEQGVRSWYWSARRKRNAAAIRVSPPAPCAASTTTWGGLTVEAWDGGPGLVDQLTKAAVKNGIRLVCDARATALAADDAGAN